MGNTRVAERRESHITYAGKEIITSDGFPTFSLSAHPVRKSRSSSTKMSENRLLCVSLWMKR
jgi:hypothetical protein